PFQVLLVDPDLSGHTGESDTRHQLVPDDLAADARIAQRLLPDVSLDVVGCGYCPDHFVLAQLHDRPPVRLSGVCERSALSVPSPVPRLSQPWHGGKVGQAVAFRLCSAIITRGSADPAPAYSIYWGVHNVKKHLGTLLLAVLALVGPLV